MLLLSLLRVCGMDLLLLPLKARCWGFPRFATNTTAAAKLLGDIDGNNLLFWAAEDQMGSRRYFYLRCMRSSAKLALLVLCGFRREVAVALRLRGCGVVMLRLNCYRLNFHESLICMGTDAIAASNLSRPDGELLLWRNPSGLYRFDENSIFASRDLAWSF